MMAKDLFVREHLCRTNRVKFNYTHIFDVLERFYQFVRQGCFRTNRSEIRNNTYFRRILSISQVASREAKLPKSAQCPKRYVFHYFWSAALELATRAYHNESRCQRPVEGVGGG